MAGGRDDTDSGPDIVLVILERVRRANPALTDDQAREIEQGVRNEYGGKRFRVAKRKKHLTAAERRAIVDKALKSDAPMQQIASDSGIDRATLYRFVKRGGGG